MQRKYKYHALSLAIILICFLCNIVNAQDGNPNTQNSVQDTGFPSHSAGSEEFKDQSPGTENADTNNIIFRAKSEDFPIKKIDTNVQDGSNNNTTSTNLTNQESGIELEENTYRWLIYPGWITFGVSLGLSAAFYYITLPIAKEAEDCIEQCFGDELCISECPEIPSTLVGSGSEGVEQESNICLIFSGIGLSAAILGHILRATHRNSQATSAISTQNSRSTFKSAGIDFMMIPSISKNNAGFQFVFTY